MEAEVIKTKKIVNVNLDYEETGKRHQTTYSSVVDGEKTCYSSYELTIPEVGIDFDELYADNIKANKNIMPEYYDTKEQKQRKFVEGVKDCDFAKQFYYDLIKTAMIEEIAKNVQNYIDFKGTAKRSIGYAKAIMSELSNDQKKEG